MWRVSCKASYQQEERIFGYSERKTRQLCEQVAEVINIVLAGCGDETLSDLYVEDVEPAPNASRLRVILSADAGASAPLIMDALERSRGYLRHQIAGEIHRKRTPELCFMLVAPR